MTTAHAASFASGKTLRSLERLHGDEDGDREHCCNDVEDARAPILIRGASGPVAGSFASFSSDESRGGHALPSPSSPRGTGTLSLLAADVHRASARHPLMTSDSEGLNK